MVEEEHQNQKPTKRWQTLPKPDWRWVFAGIVLSLVVHLGSGLRLSYVANNRPQVSQDDQKKKTTIRFKVPPAKKPKPKIAPKRIVEVEQEETEAPDEPSALGRQNHRTEKETRLANQRPRDKGQDPGKAVPPSTKKSKPKTAQPPKKVAAQPPPRPPSKAKPPVTKPIPGGQLSFGSMPRDYKPRNNYERMLPTLADLSHHVNAGYQDHLDDEIAEGDRIDINTQNYRYIGYFTGMRKAIELVWTYPTAAAQRRMEGEVGLEFKILSDGRATSIKVLKSSGFALLDDAIVDAIKLASPFSPLPEGFGKEQLVITGSFRYVLQSYGSH